MSFNRKSSNFVCAMLTRIYFVFSFENGSGENIFNRKIEITLWDLVPHNEALFLGECLVDLEKAFIDDRAVWYRLEDPKSLRAQTLANCVGNLPSYNVSPRGSAQLLSSDVSRFMRRNDYSFQRSISDDCDSIGSGGETTLFLHPDHAWGCSSRRGSSQSEVIEIDTYQLGKDFSKSLPGSRRSSFQDQEKKSGDITPVLPNIAARRRSSCVRKDPDEILKSLKAVKGELGRTMSLQREQEYNRTSRRGRLHRDSIVGGFNESFSNEDASWRGSGSFQNSNTNLTQQQPELILGPGQRRPKSYHMTFSKFGDVLLEFKTSRSHVDLRVSCLLCRLMWNSSSIFNS